MVLRTYGDKVAADAHVGAYHGPAAEHDMLCSIELRATRDFVARLGNDEFGSVRLGGCGGSHWEGRDCAIVCLEKGESVEKDRVDHMQGTTGRSDR